MRRGRPSIAVIGTRGVPASYGGFETCAEKTAERWVRDGEDVVVYCRRSHFGDRPDRYKGMRLHYMPSLDRWGLGTPTAALAAVIHLVVFERGARRVHLYNNGNALLLPFLTLFGRRVLLSADGIEWKREKWGRAQRWAHRLGETVSSRWAGRLIADNEEVASYYREKHGIEPVVIAYGAEDIRPEPEVAAPILESHGLEPGGYFIFVGRVVPEKGLHELIDAYERLNTPHQLVIVGDAEPSAFRDSVFERANERVRLVGYQYGEDYEQLLANAAAYVSASRLEGTSPSLLSSMAAGVPCLVNGIAENRATAGDAVLYFAEHDGGDLARTWQRLINDPDLAFTMVQRAMAHVDVHYRWDGIADHYLETFADLDGHRPRKEDHRDGSDDGMPIAPVLRFPSRWERGRIAT